MPETLLNLEALPETHERYHGQLDIIAPDVLAKPKYLFVGAGAIGSFTCSMLAKMGGKDITVIDFDTIEEHNISNQFYPVDEIGTPKVDALQAVAHEFSGESIKTHCMEWPFPLGDEPDFDMVISCVDKMEVRKALWDHYKTRTKHFIDGRMGAEFLRAFAVDTGNKEEVDYYASTLHTQAEAVQARCTEKTIMYTVLMVSGILLGLVKRSLLGQKRPVEASYDCSSFAGVRVLRG